MIEKTIRIWIDEEPVDPKPGDFWIRSWKGEDDLTVHRKTIEGWYSEGFNFTVERIAYQYGIDIPALDRAHLIGG